jgi:YihY family inner membrane protein
VVNAAERLVRRVDEWQQRHTVPAFVYAVIKKYSDDEASNLVALLTYYAFLATFPLLLAMSGIFGLVLAGHPHLQRRLTESAFSEFPIIGTQLRSQVGVASLHHSGPALVIGIAGALWGARGLAHAVQNLLNTAWAVPRVDRPGFPLNYLRSLALLGLLALGVVATAAAATAAATAHTLGLVGAPWRVLWFVLSALVDIGLFWAAFRVATAGTVRGRQLLPAAVLAGTAWQTLISLAGLIVTHYLRHAQAVAGLFGIVLGLLAWFALQATVTVYAIEADVVRVRRLWPRSVVQPPLTDSDRRALRAATQMETRRPEQQVSVRFRRKPAP